MAKDLFVKNEPPKGSSWILITELLLMFTHFLIVVLAVIFVVYVLKKGRKKNRYDVNHTHQVQRKRRQERAFSRGKQFEHALYNQIANALPAEGVIFHDILIEDERGTTQIDMIVILPAVFLVIEAKQYSGLIVGQRHDRVWTQILKKGAMRNTFQNPFHQNYRHLKALEVVTGLSAEHMTSWIVFGGRCQFKDNRPPQGVFLNADSAIEHLNHYRNHSPRFTDQEIETLCGKIALARQAGSIAFARHVNLLRQQKTN